MDYAPIFAKLTPAQRNALDVGGWHVGTPKRPPTNTMKRLVSMRLMTEALKPFMGIQVMEYSVPAAVRQAWVAWKAEQAQEKVS